VQRIHSTYRGSKALAGLVLATLLAAACSDGDGSGPPEPFDELGGTPPSDAELATYPKALPAPAYASGAGATASIAATPSSYVIPESTLPPVQAQGTASMQGYPGSCEAWSAGYAKGSYVANLSNRQDI